MIISGLDLQPRSMIWYCRYHNLSLRSSLALPFTTTTSPLPSPPLHHHHFSTPLTSSPSSIPPPLLNNCLSLRFSFQRQPQWHLLHWSPGSLHNVTQCGARRRFLWESGGCRGFAFFWNRRKFQWPPTSPRPSSVWRLNSRYEWVRCILLWLLKILFGLFNRHLLTSRRQRWRYRVPASG